jgi:hypothetical protein
VTQWGGVAGLACGGGQRQQRQSRARGGAHVSPEDHATRARIRTWGWSNRRVSLITLRCAHHPGDDHPSSPPPQPRSRPVSWWHQGVRAIILEAEARDLPGGMGAVGGPHRHHGHVHSGQYALARQRPVALGQAPAVVGPTRGHQAETRWGQVRGGGLFLRLGSEGGGGFLERGGGGGIVLRLGIRVCVYGRGWC